MRAASPLDRLAEACDIEPGYTDIWQQDHRIGDDTKRALLSAMGVPAGSDAEIETALAAFDAQTFERLTPEVIVEREGVRIDLPITVDAGGKGRLAFSIITEHGDTHDGDMSIGDLQTSGQTAVHGRPPGETRALPLPLDLPLGYHRCVVIFDEAIRSETAIIVTPKRAYWPPALDREGGLTGLTAPLYGLRSARNAGIGDFADLSTLAETIAPQGAAFVGVNPVHALFPSQPDRFSPYAPSSRRFLNILMIALDRVPELISSRDAQAILARSDVRTSLNALRADQLVDYRSVAELKLAVLEALFATFLASPATSPRRQRFRTFVKAGGQALQRHARFEALSEHMLRDDPSKTDWHDWPAVYRTPESAAVQAFADHHADRVTFHAYLQWLADEQLDQARQSALTAGMPIGLYLDLAVGVAGDGAEAWSDQDLLIDGVRIGAPPDDFNPNGQNWGLLPLSPKAMRARGYRPFIDLLRGTMRHAGALRIDHVLGLARSFWLPEDRDVPGAYIRYPLQDLLGIVALESRRQHCVVIGEDLGTVPKTLRSALDDHGLLGCRLLYFEQDDQGGCRPSSAYPKACIASIGTHDLPTLRGFWEGRDIDWRERLGLYAEADLPTVDRTERRQAAKRLLRLLAAEDLLPDGMDPERPPETVPWMLVDAFHRFLGRTPAALKAIQLEDALGAIEQANLPGTIDEHPNWRRKISVSLEALAADQRLSTSLRQVAVSLDEPSGNRSEPAEPRTR